MIITYKNREVGGLGFCQGSYFFTIKTKKTHKTYEFKAASLAAALKKCDNICEELAKK